MRLQSRNMRTIEKDELTDKDTVVETVIEPAKTEEKEKRMVPRKQ